MILFLIGSALAFWMHNTAPPLVGSLVGAGAMSLVHASLDRKRALANLILFAALLCVATVLPIIVSVAASHAVTPILLPRTFIWVQVGVTVLISASVLWSSRIAIRSLSVVTLVVLMSLLQARFDSAKEPWLGLVTILSTESMTEDALIVLPNSVQIPLEYCGAHEFVDAQSVRLWDGEARCPLLEQVFGVPYIFSPKYVLRCARRAESAQRRLWVIRRTGQSDPRSLALTEHLASLRSEPELLLHFRQSGLVPEVRLLVYPPREANKQ